MEVNLQNFACDVDHAVAVDVLDIQLAAGHWNQSGTYTGDGGSMVRVGVGSPQLSAVLNRLASELVVLQAQNAALEVRIGALEGVVSAGK